MFGMLISEGGTSTPRWFVTTTSRSEMEMEDHIYGIHHWSTPHQEAT